MATRYAKSDVWIPHWVVVDCKDQVVGRIATRIANILRGKTKPLFTPHAEMGDGVIAVNVGDLRFTGKKWEQKRYWRHSGYPGGIHSRTAAEMKERHPEAVLRHAVKGMLPKNFLADRLIKKLKIYPGAEHPHAAQQPVAA